MKKKYLQPYAMISQFGAVDILLASGDTEISDDGWLMKGFTVQDANNASGARSGSK